MSESTNTPNQKRPSESDIQFGDEMLIEEAGFSFRPILGFELEVDGAVYMYSEDGILEISLIGGQLDNTISIAELNDELAADFMENFDSFELVEAGKDTIQGITGFLSEIRFFNAEEEGLGCSLICSPHINQFFFVLVITSADYWTHWGKQIFSALKSHIHFHPQFKPSTPLTEIDHYPDLTIEVYESIAPEEDVVVTVERGDVSLLLAARMINTQDEIIISDILAPGDLELYHFDPATGEFRSCIAEQPLTSDHGEICVFLPSANEQNLQIGDYRFSFTTQLGLPLQEAQVIIRRGRMPDKQLVDLNLWLALKNERFNDLDDLARFISDLRAALVEQMKPINLAPGIVECYHPAPDELDSFACINIDTDLADCSYMIGEIVENSRALNIGLVDRLTQGDPPVDAQVKAISCGSPGMILSPASPHACILVNYSPFEDDLTALAKTIVEQLFVFSGSVKHPVSYQPQNAQSDQSLDSIREMKIRLHRHPILYSI